MSDKDWYLEHDKKPSLYSWIFNQMAMGAVYGAVVFFGVILLILALYALGNLLPEDSKFAPAPMPQIEGQLLLDDDRHLI